nr:uncharacterized protein LOC128705167 [Cherax quadricarinatus]
MNQNKMQKLMEQLEGFKKKVNTENKKVLGVIRRDQWIDMKFELNHIVVKRKVASVRNSVEKKCVSGGYMWMVSEYIGGDTSVWVRVEHSEVRVTVCLANQEEVRAGATTPKHHSCRLILGDADNNVLYNQRITDAALVISGSVSRVVKVTRAQTGDELPVNFISETWAGLDVQSSYSPRYLPRPQTFSADPHITMPAPLAPHKQRGREGGGKNNTVAVNEGGWRACLHTCGDKRTCAHKCCKVGVSSRPECSSSSSSTVGVPEMLQEIRKRSNQLLQTSVKKIKMNESGGTTSLSKFKYSPCGPRLMHVPTPIRSSTLQVHANDNLRQPKVVQKILKYNATETYNQANTSENKSCGNANNRVFHDSTNSHGRIPRPTYADNQCQIEKLIDEDVLNEFENGWNFDEEYQDDFPGMDIFTSEKENYTGENKVSTETYEGTFSKPLGAEYPEVSENLSTSWNRFKFRQKHTKSQNQEPNNQLHPPYTKLPPKIQLNKPYSQRSTDQRPEIKQMQQIQQVSAVPESEQRTQNISRMQSREVQRLLCQAKGRNHKAAQRHSQSSVNNNNRLLSPILKEDSQNKLTVSSLGTHITHDTQSLRPLGIQTFRYHRPSSPSAVKAIQPQRFIRPTETESNYDERCVRTFGEQSKQPQSSTHLSRAQANTHQESLALQTKQISRPTVSQENQAGHIQTPIRPLGQQANQGQRPVQLPFEPTNDFAGTMPPFPQTRQIKTPLRMPSPYTYQKPQQTSVVQSIRNQRLPQPLDSRGFTSQNHYPRLANNQNQTASYIFSNESSKPEQASFQEKHQEPIPFRSYGSIPQEYQTLNYPQVTSSCLPHTSLPNFQHHEDEQVVTPGEHSDSGRSALVQQLHQSNVNLVSRRHQSLEDQVMPVQLHSLNYPSQTLDEDYYSQGSDYKDWSALQDYELPFDISKQEMCESSSNPSNSSHLKPVAGIKPSVSYSGQCTGSTQDKNDPFSHLTKEWTSPQWGRPRSKLNIFTPTVPTKELRCGAKGSVSSKEPRQHNDDWRDLEMFQWCRQQEMLALQSLYHRVQEPVARKPNEPQQAGGESDPSCGNQPPASDTRNTHKISPGKLHITYGAWDKNPAVNVGLTGIGGVQQNININLSGILGDAGVTQAAPLPLSSPATFSQSRGEPQVRGILKKPSKDVWSAAPDIFEGIL